MRGLSYVLAASLVTMAALLIVPLFMRADWHAERSISIAATPERLWPWLAEVRRWPEWTAWSKERDPTLEIEPLGPAMGPGAAVAFKGKTMGRVVLQIAAATQPTLLDYELRLGSSERTSQGRILLRPEGDTTRVSWRVGGSVGLNPVLRFMLPFLEESFAADLDQGLRTLKKRVELVDVQHNDASNQAPVP